MPRDKKDINCIFRVLCEFWQKRKGQLMNKKAVTRVVFILLGTGGVCWAGGCGKNLATCQPELKPNRVETILKKLSAKTKELKTYQAGIEYLFSQPDFDSNTLRTGVLYYEKSGGKSNLRINFQTLKQDDEKVQKYAEHFIFDGVWLTVLDYQIKTHKRYQQAEPNKPVDAFDLVSKNLPIVGFTKIENLKKQFEIELIERQKSGSGNFVRLYLKVRRDSIYKDDYSAIEFWIDKKLYFPAKIIATSTGGDIYEITFIKPKINKRIAQKVFKIKVPKDFDAPEIFKLKKKTK